ncbi:MAG: DUF4917 family protein [Gemmatimonadaceae bacterium]
MPEIHNWLDIADQYADTLLLGNGASIGLHSGFSYPSLYGYAGAQELIGRSARAIFDQFSTTDFEWVMLLLWNAERVNAALRIEEDATRTTYAGLRDALIKSVRALHVEYDNVRRYMPPIGSFIEQFSKVFSLNYDLTLYWALREANESYKASRFKDCWISGVFDRNWERLKEPIGTDETTLVFYPHGNLVLVTNPIDGEIKISRNDGSERLLDSIIDAWQSGDWLPLFVSEGSTQQKEAAIRRSDYLSTVYEDVMRDLGRSVVVYGWSMGDNDDHILRRLCAKDVRKMAISVYRGDRSGEQLDTACEETVLRVHRHNRDIELQFFDSSSAGCWKNQSPDEAE